MYRRYFKRVMDVCVAALMLAFSLPVNLIVVILLLFNNKGKVFFVQPRPGKNGKIFHILKYKTMNDRRNTEGELLPDIQRLTLIGKFIRRTSLDELPQLINVILGDLSLVGPRPLLVDYLPFYNSFQKRRHEVTPGITGWAQVNGRNSISWEDKFAFDVWYVDNLSFLLDLKILWLTILNVIASRHVNSSQDNTMEKFRGSAE